MNTSYHFDPRALEFQQVAGITLPHEVLRQLKMMLSDIEIASMPHGMLQDANVAFGPDACVFDDSEGEGGFYDDLYEDANERDAKDIRKKGRFTMMVEESDSTSAHTV